MAFIPPSFPQSGGMFRRKRRGPLSGGVSDMEQMPTGQPVSQPERKGPNWGAIGRNALGNVGDAIAQYYGVAPVYGPMQAQNQALQQRAELLAQQQRARSQQIADENEEWYRREDYKRENPGPTALERNVDAYMQFTPEQRQAYGQMNPEENIVVPIPGRGTYVGPSSGLPSAFGQLPQKPVGKLTPIEPTMQNTPAPELGANGLPATLTRDQYKAVVNARGKADTDAWMKRHNIRVTN